MPLLESLDPLLGDRVIHRDAIPHHLANTAPLNGLRSSGQVVQRLTDPLERGLLLERGIVTARHGHSPGGPLRPRDTPGVGLRLGCQLGRVRNPKEGQGARALSLQLARKGGIERRIEIGRERSEGAEP